MANRQGNIARILVVDPDSGDYLVYQVPRHSRNLALLLMVLELVGVEHVLVEPDNPLGSQPWHN